MLEALVAWMSRYVLCIYCLLVYIVYFPTYPFFFTFP